MDANERDELAMAWMTVDDKLHGHRKIIKLGPDRVPAAGLWILCGSWSADHLTDGWVPSYVVEEWDPELKLAARLVEVKLWHEETVDGETGYRFHDWCEINRSREEIEKSRSDARERQRQSRDRRRQSNGTLGPDDGGGAHGQTALDVVTRDTNVTPIGPSRDVTRDTTSCHTVVTPLPIPPPSLRSTSKDLSDSVGRDRAARDHPDDPPGFRAWYVIYPRHEAVGTARRAYKAARKKTDEAALLSGAERYRAKIMRERTQPQHIALPASWLNGERWLDETPRQLRSTSLNDY